MTSSPPPMKIERIYKYQGVVIQDNLKWNEQVQLQVTKAIKRKYHLRRPRKLYINNETLRVFFSSVVFCLSVYGIAAWFYLCNTNLKKEVPQDVIDASIVQSTNLMASVKTTAITVEYRNGRPQEKCQRRNPAQTLHSGRKSLPRVTVPMSLLKLRSSNVDIIFFVRHLQEKCLCFWHFLTWPKALMLSAVKGCSRLCIIL